MPKNFNSTGIFNLCERLARGFEDAGQFTVVIDKADLRDTLALLKAVAEKHEETAETAGWTWLEGFVDVGLGHFNDRDYSADEMVDAFMAGRESVNVLVC